MSISIALLVFFISLADLAPKTLGSEDPLSFSFEQFHKNGTLDPAIALYGDAVVEDSAVRMTRAGKIIYRKPVKFIRGNYGFSTYFSFSISPAGANDLAFFLDSANWHLFRFSKEILVVKFANNASGSPIGVKISLKLSAESCSSSDANLVLSSGRKQHSWVDYDGLSKKIEVRLSKSRAMRPASPLISCPIDISSLLQEEALLVGISSSSEYSGSTENNSTYSSCIYTWSFMVKNVAPYLFHSEPLDPRSYLVSSQDGSTVYQRNSSRWVSVMAWLSGLVCGILIAFTVLFVRKAISRRSQVTAVEYPLDPVQILYEKAVVVGEKCSKTAQT